MLKDFKTKSKKLDLYCVIFDTIFERCFVGTEEKKKLAFKDLEYITNKMLNE